MARLLAWVRLRERQLAVIAAFLGFVVGALSAAVALFQAALLADQQALPYETAVYAAQLEAGRDFAAASVASFDAVGMRLEVCRDLNAGAQLADGVQARINQRIEDSGEALAGAAIKAYYTLPSGLFDKVGALEGQTSAAANLFAGKDCPAIEAAAGDYEAMIEPFWAAYRAFLVAARQEARIDTLSESAVVRALPREARAP